MHHGCRMFAVVTFLVGVVLASSCHDAVAQNTSHAPRPRFVDTGRQTDFELPAWARAARWYQVDVRRFRNGDTANDPANVTSWTADWPATAKGKASDADLADRRYGGDLAGLKDRLTYLSKLGFNALYLSSVFDGDGKTHSDLRHVADVIGVSGSADGLREDASKPKTWKYSVSDRVFIDLLAEAHRAKFHVVVEVDTPAGVGIGNLPEVLRRWMDPNADGNPSDGVDGWVLRLAEDDPATVARTWRGQIKKINPKAVLVGNPIAKLKGATGRDAMDLVVAHELGDAILRFFKNPRATGALKKIADFLETFGAGAAAGGSPAVVTPLGGPHSGRLIDAVSGKGGKIDRAAFLRGRLATIVHGFVAGSPITYYGEEVGMPGGKGESSRAPMWWADLPAAKTKAPEHRDEQAALIHWLNGQRNDLAPLRTGEFRDLMLDEKQGVFAFSRSLPGDEVVLIVNYGTERTKVVLPVGSPGQVVGVVRIHPNQPPRRRPGAKVAVGEDRGKPSADEIKPLRMTGSRQVVDSGGHASVWLEPMSVRVILVHEGGPRWSFAPKP